MSNDQRRMLEYVARAAQAGGNSTPPPALTSNHRSIRDDNNDNRIACRVVLHRQDQMNHLAVKGHDKAAEVARAPSHQATSRSGVAEP